VKVLVLMPADALERIEAQGEAPRPDGEGGNGG
jgi:hypothetical protein